VTTRRGALSLALLLLVVAACGTEKVGDGAIRVFAASSLQEVVPEEAAALEAWGSTVRVEATFDSSSRLRAQISQGAQADLFLSADQVNVDFLAQEGVSFGASAAFAGNRLVLVVPATSTAVDSWAGLARPGVRVVAADPLVPVTTYADQLVSLLAADRDAPADFESAYRRNIVSREDNVRAVLAKVELGEADAGFVYATDARTSSRVRVLPLPHGATVEVIYVGVVLSEGSRGDAAAAFLAWLSTEQGAAILASHGFSRLPG
jgi:molybdate transport system substrate-binding protein